MECFNGKLGKVNLAFGPTTHPSISIDVDGYYDSTVKLIHIDQRVTTRRLLLSTLAHEMVHQLQDEGNLPLTHGAFFNKHASRLLKYGLTL